MTGRAYLQQSMLAMIDQHGQQTTVQLMANLERSRSKTSSVASKLVRQGFLHRTAPGTFDLTDMGRDHLAAGVELLAGPRGPRPPSPLVPHLQDDFRQRAWTAMRIMGLFTLPDIILRAACAADGETTGNLRFYVNRLIEAGYVQETQRRSFSHMRGDSSNGHKVYRLIKDTGDLAPRATATRFVDFNVEGATRG